MKLRSFVLAGTAVAALAAAPGAGAAVTDTDSVPVTGTTIGTSLAFGAGIVPAAFGVGLDSTASYVDATTPGVVPIVAIGAWNLRLSGTNAGKLAQGAGCTTGSATLNNPLQLWATAGLGNMTTSFGSSSALFTLSGSPTSIATGVGTNAVTLNYRWTPHANDQLAAGCLYTNTTTVDIAAS